MRRAFLLEGIMSGSKTSAKPVARPAARAPRKTAGLRLSYCAGEESFYRSALGRVRVHRIEMLEISWIFRRPH